MDLISRQAAIDIANDLRDCISVDGYWAWIERLKRLPSAQPERKTGKCVWCDSPFRIEYYWIDREGCTASFQDEERHVVATGIAKFCPNCGAKMEEGGPNECRYQ